MEYYIWQDDDHLWWAEIKGYKKERFYSRVDAEIWVGVVAVMVDKDLLQA